MEAVGTNGGGDGEARKGMGMGGAAEGIGWRLDRARSVTGEVMFEEGNLILPYGHTVPRSEPFSA